MAQTVMCKHVKNCGMMKFCAAGSVADRRKTQEMWANQKRPDINAQK